MRLKKTCLCEFVLLLISFSNCSQLRFNEVKIQRVRRGQSQGMSWGFLDDDNYPDLFISRHNESHPALHINRAAPGSNGTRRVLVEVTEEYLGDPPASVHKHSAQWADFDNDGDQDLLLLHGTKKGWGGYANQFFLNGPQLPFADVAESQNMTYPAERGNTPLFFDYDSDGLLDILLCAGKPRKPLQSERIAVRVLKHVHENNSSRFVEKTDDVKMLHLKSTFCKWASLADVNDDGKLDMVMKLGQTRQDNVAYQLNENGFDDLSDEVKLPAGYLNLLFVDFNNDLKLDMFGLPFCIGSNKLRQSSPTDAETPVRPGTQWISFYTKGMLQVGTTINHAPIPDDPIYAFTDGVYKRQLNLNLPDLLVTNLLDLEHHGWYRIWNTSSSFSKTGWWTLPISAYKYDTSLNVFLHSSKPISHLKEPGNKGSRGRIQKGLLSMKVNGTFQPVNIESPTEICGIDVVSADFDNDMDLDLFILRDTIYCDQKSIFLWNNGNGTFEVDERSPFNCEEHYRPESLAVMDYNLDGFMDLSMSSGRKSNPFQPGSYALMENAGNSNSWIEIRLVGSGRVNRDAIGSWVIARTPDGQEQYRAQSGGMRSRSQDWQILHFGLGRNDFVDLEVHWSDQTVSTLQKVASNQLIKIFREQSNTYKEYQQ